MTTAFWPTLDHWSVAIPRDTDHLRLAALEPTGFVALRDAAFAVPEREYLDLEYMDWKSGGDTNFAPIATADGELDCRGFWNDGDERPDKDATFTSNALKCPTIATYVESIGANFGRVRVIKLEPQDHATSLRSFHRDDNNRFNPDDQGWVVRSWVELTDNRVVVLHMIRMARVGVALVNDLADPSSFVRGVHVVGDLPNLGQGTPADKRHFVTIADERLLLHFGSSYGGNALLGKKCLALRIASVMARDDGWLAEHMVIMGIEDIHGKVTYITRLPLSMSRTVFAAGHLSPSEVEAVVRGG